MAPNRRHKSHLLTTVLRCRIATCSSIFLKTTEIRQKSAVQRNTTISSRSIPLGPPQPPFLTAQPGFIARLFPRPRQAAGAPPPRPAAARAPAPRPPRPFRRDGTARTGVSAPVVAWSCEKAPRGSCSNAPPRAEKGEGKITPCCCCVKGGSESRFRSRALECNGKIPLASGKRKKIRLNPLQPFRAQWMCVSITRDMDVQRNQRIIHSVNSAAAIRWLKRKVNTNRQSQHIS